METSAGGQQVTWGWGTLHSSDHAEQGISFSDTPAPMPTATGKTQGLDADILLASQWGQGCLTHPDVTEI